MSPFVFPVFRSGACRKTFFDESETDTVLATTVRSHEPLNVTLEDLHSADKRGKWWLVGSAWAGDPLVDAAAASTAGEPVDTEAQDMFVDQDRSLVLLKLARKQGMNTDVRRNIFVVLMSSDVGARTTVRSCFFCKQLIFSCLDLLGLYRSV